MVNFISDYIMYGYNALPLVSLLNNPHSAVFTKDRDSTLWNGCSQEDIELCWPVKLAVGLELLCCVNELNENI